VVADRFENRPLLFVDDLDIAKDGTIYFSDASMRYGIDEYLLDFIEGKATGRLFSFDPRSPAAKRLEVSYRERRRSAPMRNTCWSTKRRHIAHSSAGRCKAGSTVAENLPGYPDNISFNGRDLFWVALAGPRIKLLEEQYKSPFTRKVMFRLYSIGLAALPVTPEPYGCVVAINLQGQVVATLQDPGGRRSTP
jgi:sugar lactone lactonase YvrE